MLESTPVLLSRWLSIKITFIGNFCGRPWDKQPLTLAHESSRWFCEDGMTALSSWILGQGEGRKPVSITEQGFVLGQGSINNLYSLLLHHFCFFLLSYALQATHVGGSPGDHDCRTLTPGKTSWAPMSVNSRSNVLGTPSEAASASFSFPGIYAEHQALGRQVTHRLVAS